MSRFLRLSFLIIFILSTQLSIGHDLSSVIGQMHQLDSKGRTRLLFVQFGYNPSLLDNDDSVSTFLTALQSEFSQDKNFQDYVSYFKIIQPLITEKDADTKIEFLEKQLKTPQLKNSELFTAIHLHTIGTYYYINADYNHAFENMIQANELFNKIGYDNIPQIGVYLHDYALGNYKFGYYEKSKQLMLSSIEQPAFSPNLDVQRYYTLGLSYNQLQVSDSAIWAFLKTKEVAERYHDTVWTSLAHTGLGLVYTNLDQLDSALYHHIRSFEILRHYTLVKSNNQNILPATIELDLNFQAYLRVIHSYIKMGKIHEAKSWLTSFLKMDWTFNNELAKNYFYQSQILEKSKYIYYEVLKDYYNAIHDVENAKLYTDSFYELKNIIDNTYRANVISITDVNLQLAAKKAEIEQFKSDKQFSLFLTILLSALLLILILIILVIRSRKKKIEAEHSLKEQELQYKLNTQKAELASAQEELRMYIGTLTQKNDMIEHITIELETIKNNQTEDNEVGELDSTINKLKDYRILTEDDWTDFQVLYQKVNKELYHKILQHIPAFTESEKRYLLLISLGLNKKEIAAMLGISPDSLRVTWNRLKKKIPAQFDNSPQDFLIQL